MKNVVLICNGLGNQMSQYAFYLAMKEHEDNTTYVCMDTDHNGYELERLFNIRRKESKYTILCWRILMSRRNNIVVKFLKKALGRMGIRLKNENFDYSFDPSYTFQSSSNSIIWYGGWHNFRYFNFLRDRLLREYSFPIKKLNEYTLQLLADIERTDSVAIHIRRGDYLKAGNQKLFGDICTLKYYQNAIQYIKSQINHPTFFIFSNDVEWVKDNLNLRDSFCVNGNYGEQSWMDMYLMSKCKSLIIANSTFSWWGAYLSAAEIIICPQKFVNDNCSGEIYPTHWIRVNS